MGDPIVARKLIEHEKRTGKKTSINKYGYKRAFTYNPSLAQREVLANLLEFTWGSRVATFCDPMSGGGSIPFEALRLGLKVQSNELNPVATLILLATMAYPSTFGSDLAADIENYGQQWARRVRLALSDFFSPQPANPDGSLKGGIHLWCRTVQCPVSGKPVPLAPNWWLRKGSDPLALKLIAPSNESKCRFEIVRGKPACDKANPDKGTVKRGSAVSPWTGEVIDSDYIKREAKCGRMGEQLVAIEEYGAPIPFRAARAEDSFYSERAKKELADRLRVFEVRGLVPHEHRKEGRADWACEIYGTLTWADAFSPRQLLVSCLAAQELIDVIKEVFREVADRTRAEAIAAFLGLALGKAVNYNSRHCFWDYTRNKAAHAFSRHDFAFRFAYCEFDASRNLFPWCVEQVLDAYRAICKLIGDDTSRLLDRCGSDTADAVTIRTGSAQTLSHIETGTIQCITVDPPYYDNVMYSELSNYFYVWSKRVLRDVFPSLFADELTNDEDEAVMNTARFKAMGKKAKALATADYENKMFACFKEMSRVLHPNGVLTVMFTHKQVQAWDTLGSSLMRAGFRIDASWPVHTESEASLHQAKKNAAASTILLVCRKRDASTEPAWWDDLKGQVKRAARETAQRFENEGIRGVDLYISTFGPVLSIISERWPVHTSTADPKTGDPIPLQPGEALDLARREVINLRKQGLLLGRSVEFDPVTDWYLMAWDAFRAQEFPADEARKLALALGLDLEANLVRDKRLVTKKAKTVTLALPSARRKKGMVDPEAERFPHLIDALHTAMMVYGEDGSRACQVFIDRHGFRGDSRIKALAQAAMQAIPTTRGKDGKFLRSEMTTLDALRLLVWEDLPAPTEEEIPQVQTELPLFQKPSDDEAIDEDEGDLGDEAEEDDEESEDE
jgi:adenine-specific DNA methylase